MLDNVGGRQDYLVARFATFFLAVFFAGFFFTAFFLTTLVFVTFFAGFAAVFLRLAAGFAFAFFFTCNMIVPSKVKNAISISNKIIICNKF